MASLGHNELTDTVLTVKLVKFPIHPDPPISSYQSGFHVYGRLEPYLLINTLRPEQHGHNSADSIS